MAVYMMIETSVHNPNAVAGYAEYMQKVQPMVERHGGRYLVRGGKVTPLAGGWNPEKIVLIEFPSEQSLRQWWDSPEYQAIKRLRETAVTAKAIVVEGWSPQASESKK
jgi:uncharacterized protein (DUF1330 family)